MVAKDQFGLPCWYARKVGGQQYFIPADAHTRGTDGGRILIGGQGGSVKKNGNFFSFTQNSQVRFGICQKNGYKSSLIETDRETLVERGYMQDTDDWGGAWGAWEMTVSWRYNGGGSNDPHCTLYGRGGRHSDSIKCEGSALKGTIYFQDGRHSRISKEDWHPNYDQIDGSNNVLPSNLEGWEVMQKFVVYNLDANGQALKSNTGVSGVKCELYAAIETTKGSGVFDKIDLIQSFTDNGENWGSGASDCGNVDDKIPISWNGPINVLRWDDDPDVEWRNLSIVEIDPTTRIGAVPPPDTGNPPPDDGGVPDSDMSTTGETMHDAYGVTKLYESKAGGSRFFPPDPNGMLTYNQFINDGCSLVGNGWYKVAAGTTRILLFSSPEAQARGAEYEGYATFDFEKLRQNGTWDNPIKDFKNIEYTIYIRNIKQQNTSNEQISLVTRSVRHETADKSGKGCGGSAYHNNINFVSGLFLYKKEMWHVNYDTLPDNSNGIGDRRGSGKEFGMKAVVYDLEDGSGVRLETWADQNNDDRWIKYHELEDHDDWGDDMTHCGALKKGAAIRWGSPKAIIKANNTEFEISKVSIREIVPNKRLIKGTGTGTGGSGGGGDGTGGGDGGGGTGGGGTGGGGTGGGGTGGTGGQPPPPVQPVITYCVHKQEASLDLNTISIAKKIAETMVNPDPNARFGSLGWCRDGTTVELQDIGAQCTGVNEQAVYADGLKLEGYTSNQDNDCVVPNILGTDLGTGTSIVDHGGIVLPKPIVYLIFWGQQWSTGAAVPTAAQIIAAVKDKILGSDVVYFSKLAQYGNCLTPVYGNAVYNTSFALPAGTNATHSEYEACLINTFERGLLPIPQVDNQNIYMLFTPIGYGLDNSQKTSRHDCFRPTLVPPTGGGGGTTGNLARINTRIMYIWDHVLDLSGFTCTGAQPEVPPEGSGSYTLVMDVGTETYDTALSNNFSGQNNRVRAMEVVNGIASQLFNIKTTKFGARLKRVGTPTGTIYFEVYDANREVPNVLVTFGSLDVSTIQTSYTWYEFTKDDILSYLPNGLQDDYSIGVRYDNGSSSSSSYIAVGTNKNGPYDSTNSHYAELDDGGFSTSSSWDLNFRVYKSP